MTSSDAGTRRMNRKKNVKNAFFGDV